MSKADTKLCNRIYDLTYETVWSQVNYPMCVNIDRLRGDIIKRLRAKQAIMFVGIMNDE